jgi:hypothetical protein
VSSSAISIFIIEPWLYRAGGLGRRQKSDGASFLNPPDLHQSPSDTGCPVCFPITGSRKVAVFASEGVSSRKSATFFMGASERLSLAKIIFASKAICSHLHMIERLGQ